MHLTPVPAAFKRSSPRHSHACHNVIQHYVRVVAVVFAAGALATACTSRPAQTIQLPLPVPDTLQAVPPTLHKTSIQADSDTYLITVRTRTTEDPPDNTPPDSVTLHEIVTISLAPVASGDGFILRVHSDSGMVLPTNRIPPPETLEIPRHSTTATAYVSFRSPSRLSESTNSLLCPRTPTLVSQLIPTVISRFITSRFSAFEASDSTIYSTCIGGLSVRNLLIFTSPPTNIYTSQFTISSSSDSSRVLPMHITGNTSGKATVAPDSSATVLPSYLAVTLDLTLDAKSTQRKQRLHQHIQFEISRYQ